MARVYQSTSDVISTCPLTVVKDHPTRISSPAAVGFLDQDRYILVATKISHDGGLAPVYSAGNRSQDLWIELVTLSLYYGGGLSNDAVFKFKKCNFNATRIEIIHLQYNFKIVIPYYCLLDCIFQK